MWEQLQNIRPLHLHMSVSFEERGIEQWFLSGRRVIIEKSFVSRLPVMCTSHRSPRCQSPFSAGVEVKIPYLHHLPNSDIRYQLKRYNCIFLNSSFITC